MDKRIYLCLAHMSGREQAFIQEAFDTNWVMPFGATPIFIDSEPETWNMNPSLLERAIEDRIATTESFNRHN